VNSQQLYIDALYRFSPRVTLTLSERFVYDIESNIVSVSGLSVGRRDSYRNTVGANLAFQATQRTTLNAFASNSLLRYEDIAGTDAQDSDTYRGGVGAGYQFTPRFTGRIAFEVGYLDPEDDPSVVTYTPLIGFTYQLTRTLSATVNGGATVTVGQLETGGQDETTVTPSGDARIEQSFTYGSFGLGYAHAITAEADGVTETQTAFATLRLATRRRDLQFEVTPTYAHTNAPQGGNDNDTFTLSLGVIYQIARNLALTGGYNFYRQQGNGTFGDVTQNRVFLGLQYAYPINID
jgi:opacity protein-like surface antigen